MEHNFTDANFDAEVVKSTAPVFVDFWAPWCGPCQMMGPIIAGLAEEYEGKNIKIGKCNVDENQNVAGQFNVMSIPTFAVFKPFFGTFAKRNPPCGGFSLRFPREEIMRLSS